jgi:hypothetical protein
VFQALRRLLELGIEAADPEPRQGRLDAVDDAGVLANEGFALAVRALGVLLRDAPVVKTWTPDGGVRSPS